jgi:hypothetical protein
MEALWPQGLSERCYLQGRWMSARGTAALGRTSMAPTPLQARKGTRTPDPVLTMDVLYQLSYPGVALHRRC